MRKALTSVLVATALFTTACQKEAQEPAAAVEPEPVAAESSSSSSLGGRFKICDSDTYEALMTQFDVFQVLFDPSDPAKYLEGMDFAEKFSAIKGANDGFPFFTWAYEDFDKGLQRLNAGDLTGAVKHADKAMENIDTSYNAFGCYL